MPENQIILSGNLYGCYQEFLNVTSWFFPNEKFEDLEILTLAGG